MPGVVIWQGPIDCLIQTVQREGIANGLYKGNSAMLLREIPGNFAWYGVYEGTCKALIPAGGTKKDLGPEAHLLGGALSGVTYVALLQLRLACLCRRPELASSSS